MTNLFNDYDYKTVKETGYSSNKDVLISKINEIDIRKFRSLENRTIKLGKYITIISGRNATMKTSILGLIAHPFSSETLDCFNEPLKTDISSVFRMSTKYDNEYTYNLKIEDSAHNFIFAPVKIYVGKGETRSRHRVVVSGATKGDGNFNYNTSFMSFSRLNPIAETKALNTSNASLNEKELKLLINFYERIFPSKSYNNFEGVQEGKKKETFGPSGAQTIYDFNSISSGEDNLGAIFNKLLSFQRAKQKNSNIGNGILCIDELEAGLHPSASFALFEYLLEWSQSNRVQIAFTTHSTYLIDSIYRHYEESIKRKDIIFNFISCSSAKDDKNYPIIHNPTRNLAYKELTLQNPEDVIKSHKIKLLCEDKRAEHFIKCLLDKELFIDKLEFLTDRTIEKPGIEYPALRTILNKICINFPSLLTDAFVVFDADVAAEKNFLESIKDKNRYTILPDKDNFPIEKRIAIFIALLSNNDAFFNKFNKEQTKILGEMAKKNIPTNPRNMFSEKNITIFKKWADTEKNFDDYVKYYSSTLKEDKKIFQKNILNKMNFIYSNLGLPELNESILD